MKHTTVATIIACIAAAAHAQVPDREAQFKRLEATYSTVFQEAPPLLVSWLTTARSMNLEIPSEKWKEIENEITETLRRKQTSGQGTWLRHMYAPLTDAELEHLATLLADPVMLKAKALEGAPGVQRELMEVAGASAFEWPLEAMQTVMRNHGLKAPPY